MLKRLLLCASLLLSSNLNADSPYHLIPYTNQYGQYVVYFVNHTNQVAYCWIRGIGNSYFVDTYVYPGQRSSLDYIHPPGQVGVNWTWGCQ